MRQEVEGVDFGEAFAHVTWHSSLRLLFALGAKGDWEIHKSDVSSAYLNARLDAEIYMTVPEGLDAPTG